MRWDSETKAFVVEDRELNSKFLFRPFSGEIIKVKETSWASPNTGENFRAKAFSEVPFVPDAEVAGPVYSTLQVKGNILTLFTTPDPGAWVSAQAILYRGIKRVDFRSELNTYPQMAFRAFAELETEMPGPELYRDFPFGEEPSRNPDFTSLNYVRIQSPKYSLLLAHDGTQRFFVEKRGGKTVLRNMIARETLRGDYQWRVVRNQRRVAGACGELSLRPGTVPYGCGRDPYTRPTVRFSGCLDRSGQWSYSVSPKVPIRPPSGL